MNSINKKEIEKFSNMAAEWWDPEGKFKPLHLFNPVRIKFIKEKLIYHFKLNLAGERPLDKIKILDINNSNINRAEQLFNKTNQFNISLGYNF